MKKSFNTPQYYYCKNLQEHICKIEAKGDQMKEFIIAVGQIDLKLGDKKANLKKTAEIISTAAKQNADFICLPEYLSTGSIPEEFSKLSETIPGETVDKLCEIANENSINIVTAVLEKADKNVYNTALLIDSDGTLQTSYRKMHLFMDEKNYITPGDDVVTVKTAFGTIGLMICYDIAFPEVARKLALQDAEVVFAPANWPNPFLPQWRIATSARALDNQMWVVAANRIGSDNKFSYFGRSRIVNAYGDVVVECGEKEEIQYAKINEKTSEEFKNIVNFLQDRRSNTQTSKTVDSIKN